MANGEGPLAGLKVVDLSRLAPGPFASMLLADLGADVILVEAPSGAIQGMGSDEMDEAAEKRRAYNSLSRNKRSIIVDLRQEEGRQIVHDLAKDADIFLEGFRPGVTDRLGVGYEAISKTNPKIVYASLSGYGQTGPYNHMVGHDINYISVGGALGQIGRPGQKPSIPANIVADFAGGGLMTAFSILAALQGVHTTGKGQHVDMGMADGVLYLLASQTGGVLAGGESPGPGDGMLTGARPFYDAYECADGKYLSLGSLEPQFWAALCETLGRSDLQPHQQNPDKQAEIGEFLGTTLKTKSRDEWFAMMKPIDICVAPVLSLAESLENEQMLARQMVVEVEDPKLGMIKHVGIGPKFSGTPGKVHSTAPRRGQHTDEVLASIGRDTSAVGALRESGVVGG
ncbi:MAG: CoA transferase [Chloroflexi bacterium]|nr:CaiB/BaiF CoA-transferase family protein [Chloroflexota bacterium]MDA1147331.1 CaiB/BaiF CoA-transferase family protein [Chloroflexota bacterium]MQC82500.1 CoA transferase [Chloroflexota bacterium]MQC83140.1 CoA transferase [Chloroflexota bacterium]